MLPIWLPNTGPLDFDEWPAHRSFPFPSEQQLEQYNTVDTTLDPDTGLAFGAGLDIVQGRFVFSQVEQFRSRLTPGPPRRLDAINEKSGELTSTGLWLKEQSFQEEDQVAALIKRIGGMCDSSGTDMMIYKSAGAWAPVALFHLTVDPKKSMLGPPASRRVNNS